MGNDFKPPNRRQIAGDLLDINTKKTLEASILDKLKVADVFGLTFLGDFATVERMPLLNIVMCCGDLPPSIVAIKECTSHLQAGGKKDASYVVDEFKKVVEKYDSTAAFTNLFWFDGASNVQKAGDILTAKFIHAATHHGCEHNISLFFSDIAKIAPIRVSGMLHCKVNLFA